MGTTWIKALRTSRDSLSFTPEAATFSLVLGCKLTGVLREATFYLCVLIIIKESKMEQEEKLYNWLQDMWKKTRTVSMTLLLFLSQLTWLLPQIRFRLINPPAGFLSVFFFLPLLICSGSKGLIFVFKRFCTGQIKSKSLNVLFALCTDMIYAKGCRSQEKQCTGHM